MKGVKEMEIRIYGQTLNIWRSVDETGRQRIVQKEIEYKLYDTETCGLVRAGSEDFSPECYDKIVSEKFIYTWDGQKRNKGGHRWFDCQGIIRFRKSERKQVIDFLKRKYGAELVQLRT